MTKYKKKTYKIEKTDNCRFFYAEMNGILQKYMFLRYTVEENKMNGERNMKFENLSDWIMLDHCSTRIVIGGDVEKVEDRVAFIEKSPRVRLSQDKFGIEIDKGYGGCRMGKADAWLYGPKGSSEYGKDEDSRKWCDEMLVLLGWY